MIAKGHHFPDVTLVGVVNADLTLHFPDFRAEERTFAMLVQVGGRSGRGERPGRVIVQTLDPEARPIALAAGGKEEQFYAEELERRQELGYPPAGFLVGLDLSSTSRDKVDVAGRFTAERLTARLDGVAQVLGPGPIWRERGPSRLPDRDKDCRNRENPRCAARLAGGEPRPIRRPRRPGRAGRRAAVAVTCREVPLGT